MSNSTTFVDNAEVSGEAKVSGEALLVDNAEVTGDAKVSEVGLPWVLGTTPSGKLIHWFRQLDSRTKYPVCGQNRGLRGNGRANVHHRAKAPTCPHCIKHRPF